MKNIKVRFGPCTDKCNSTQLFCLGGEWTKQLYRLLDSCEGKDVEKLRYCEKEIFKFKIKNHTSWKGSSEENKEADKKIAAIIKSSMKYQKTNDGKEK